MKNQTTTVNQVAEQYFEHIKPTMRVNSYETYRHRLDKNILPKFGERIMSRITTKQIDKFFAELSEHGWSPSYINSAIVTLKGLGNFAYENMNIPNAFRKLKSIPLIKTETKTLSKSEFERLVLHLKNRDDVFALGVLISLYTGVKIGELCALTWGDIDWKNNRIYINKITQRIPNSSKKETDTKTKLAILPFSVENMYRSVPIDKTLFDKLYAMQGKNDCFIVSGTTKISDPRKLQYKLQNIVEELGLQGVSFGTLRKTFAANFSNIYGADYLSINHATSI